MKNYSKNSPGRELYAPQAAPPILLTGTTGYVGGRLLTSLVQSGNRVRCLLRRPEFWPLPPNAWVEIVGGDCLEFDSLLPAMVGTATAYYLVHSMASEYGFEEQDRKAAGNFGRAARAAGVKKIIYLGGLGEGGELLSAHLRSRQEVGEILRNSGVPVIEFRSSIIIGSGSLSFELVRALVERLPLLVAPRWVATATQPIAIEDVIDYLRHALRLPFGVSGEFEIGGKDIVSYGDMMREYARQRGLRRVMIPVPVLTPYLSSLWLGLVTPIYARIGRKLIEGLRNPTIVRDYSALNAFPLRPRGLAAAIERALHNEDRAFAETRWSDALSASGPLRSFGGARFGSRIVDSRVARVGVAPAAAFVPIRRLGGERGWYFANLLWRLRGFLDLLLGGVGLRRGRRDPEQLRPGDTLDFWRVEVYEPDRRLRLAAEMKLPGRAWLDFEVVGDAQGSEIRQTAIFDPLGLAGLAYWYALYPVHRWLFAGMLRGIARAIRVSALG